MNYSSTLFQYSTEKILTKAICSDCFLDFLGQKNQNKEKNSMEHM